MVKKDVYFIVIAFLVAELLKILIYANKRTCGVTRLTRNDVKSQNMEYLCKYKVHRVEILQG